MTYQYLSRIPGQAGMVFQKQSGDFMKPVTDIGKVSQLSVIEFLN